MKPSSTMTLPTAHDVLAPDGSEVRILLSLPAGSMAHFQLQPNHISHAACHRSVEEIWYILSGHGEMWRSTSGEGETTQLSSGTCLTIPAGTIFQFRCAGTTPLAAIAVTMPPWPGDGEAEIVTGKWEPNLG